MSESPPPVLQPNWGLGVAIGIGIGMALGAALQNVGLGLALGAAIGVAFALAFGGRGDASGGDGTDPRPGDPGPEAAAEPAGAPDDPGTGGGDRPQG